MKGWRICICIAAAVVLVALGWRLASSAAPVSAAPSVPPAHLGYGMNVRSQAMTDPLFAPLGFEWIKLAEEYAGSPPTERLPYKVLFVIACDGMPADLALWGDHVEAIAVAGRGFVEAYEVGNEPNLRSRWGYQRPDPARYVAVLREAYTRIKAVDPAAAVVSAGLAPTGRIPGTCSGWNGNDCVAMDEREYARQMFRRGAGEVFDAFGYHPVGFAYPPETDPYTVPNGFSFRGVEVMYAIMEEYGLGRKPVWATEMGWLRDPSFDPGDGDQVPGWCHNEEVFNTYFEWMDVSEVQQANYLTRSFAYADANWPWMGAMFVWNLDWYDYNWLCEPSRYFSVRKDDGTPLGAPALAYDALAAMEKRPGTFGPRLAVSPPSISLLAGLDQPQTFTRSLAVLNVGYRVLTWTAAISTGLEVTPTLAAATGSQGTPLVLSVDSTGYLTGTYTGAITVTATTTDVLDVPQVVPVTLLVVPHAYRTHLPCVLRVWP